MKFTVFETEHRMYTVHKDIDGGCGSFDVTFPTMEDAQNFIIRILIMDADLSPSDMDMNRI